MLENKKIEIDWDINQDINFDKKVEINDEVFHKKFGNGKVIYTDDETAEVNFKKFGIKKIYIKYLLTKN